MLLTPDGWLTHPDFIRIDGIADKVYSQKNTGEGGLACHSVVGEEPDEQDGVPNRFLSRDKNPDGSYTKYAAASCVFILRKRKKHIQMYPITASTWTTGGREGNTTTWPMEAEGGPLSNTKEPLTKHQEDGFLAIATAWEELKGRKLVVGETVRAHGRIAQQFGYAATACESGRYKNAWARLAAGERIMDMTALEQRVNDILRALFAGTESAKDETGKLRTPEQLLALAEYRLKEAAKGQSINDKAASAVAIVLQLQTQVKNLKLSTDPELRQQINKLESDIATLRNHLKAAGGE